MEDTKHNTDRFANQLASQLRTAGLSDQAIKAAWPSWWSDELASELSGRAELRFALARRLGLSPKSLSGDRVEFIWTKNAKIKNGANEDAANERILVAFAHAIGRTMTSATATPQDLNGLTPLKIRHLILKDRPFVDLRGVLAFYWAVGIPVVHLRVFPLPANSMHAMVVRVGSRPAVFLARDSNYPAPTAFTLAHELGHIVLGHVAESSALIELEDPVSIRTSDEQELGANRFARTLLTANEQPKIETNANDFKASTLAKTVIKASEQYKIEPGTLALLLAHDSGAWKRSMAALKFIYPTPGPMWCEVNAIAKCELDWDALTHDEVDYALKVLGDC